MANTIIDVPVVDNEIPAIESTTTNIITTITGAEKLLLLDGSELKSTTAETLKEFAQNFANLPEFPDVATALGTGYEIGKLFRLPLSAGNRLLSICMADIIGYTAGTADIIFAPDGIGGFDIDFKITPISYNAFGGGAGAIDNYDRKVDFSVGGSSTVLAQTNETNDTSVNTGVNGAGVYIVVQTFKDVSNNVLFNVKSIYKVDALGVIIASKIHSGITINSVSGLSVNLTSHIVQTGIIEDLKVGFLDNTFYPISSQPINPTDTVTLPYNAVATAVYTDLDNTFWSDMTAFDLAHPEYASGVLQTII